MLCGNISYISKRVGGDIMALIKCDCCGEIYDDGGIHMKRIVLSIFCILIIVSLLCSCSPKNEYSNEKLDINIELTKERWKSLAEEDRIISFFEGNVGEISGFGSSISIKWEFNGEFIKVSYSLPLFGEQYIAFRPEIEDGILFLKATDEQSIFVQESLYSNAVVKYAGTKNDASEITESSEAYDEKIGYITLSYDDGTSETMTIRQYSDLLSSNKLKFDKINDGATLTISGYSQEVKDTININGTHFPNGYIYLTSDKSPFKSKGFSMYGIYIKPLSKDKLTDIEIDEVITLTGKYVGNINLNTPIISAVSEIKILGE